MATLGSLAHILRSKNAGPFHLTVDFLFPDGETYQKVMEARVLTPDLVATLYRVAVEHVRVYGYPSANAIKVTLPRRISSGNVGDPDVYGSQQHTLLAELEMPEEEVNNDTH